MLERLAKCVVSIQSTNCYGHRHKTVREASVDRRPTVRDSDGLALTVQCLGKAIEDQYREDSDQAELMANLVYKVGFNHEHGTDFEPIMAAVKTYLGQLDMKRKAMQKAGGGG